MSRDCLLPVLLSCTLIHAAPSLAETPGPGTMRLDYFHTGGLGTEAFSVDRVVVEPLPWPGNPDRTVDASHPGEYLAEPPGWGPSRGG